MADVVAVDLGGTNIRAARVSSDGKILARDKISTLAKEGGMSAVMERVAGLIQKVRGPETIAVGVGTPGVPDWETGEMLLPAVNIPNSGGFPLSATLSKATKLPVFADNDGNLAALAETWLGAGIGEPYVLIFTLGTGIGGGMVINGKTYHGIKNLGTEFGHVSIDVNGRKCGCGNSGCVEALRFGFGRRPRRSRSRQESAGGSFQRCLAEGVRRRGHHRQGRCAYGLRSGA